MQYSKLFGKTVKASLKDMQFASHQLLYRGGFVRELSAGRYEFLPLGLRVQQKLIDLVDREMESIGSQRMSIPLLQPMEYWQKTNRDTVWGKDLMRIADRQMREFALSATGEGIVMEMIKDQQLTYKELPVMLHQFITKFRDEKRARGGIMRTREFIMKDGYSFHASEESLLEFYQQVHDTYKHLFAMLKIPVYASWADSGALGGDYCHEFQAVCEAGEDKIVISNDTDFVASLDKVTVKERKGQWYLEDGRQVEIKRSIEVGHIFKYDHFYSQPHEGYFTAADGTRQFMWTGAYGFGLDRVIATTVELNHDDRGIIWPVAIAPFQGSLVTFTRNKSDKSFRRSSALYTQLLKAGIKVLWDDRLDKNAGEKLADADLIGNPFRIVVSENSLQQGGYELTQRADMKTQIVSTVSQLRGRITV